MSVSVIRFYTSYVKDNKRFFLIPILFALFMAIYESLSPFVIKLIIDRVNNYNDDNRFWQFILLPAITYIVLTEVVNILFRLRDYAQLKSLPIIKSKMIMDLLQHLCLKKYSFFLNTQSGTLVTKISDLAKGVETLFGLLIDVILWRTFSIFVAAFWMSLISGTLTIITLIWAATFVCLVIFFSKRQHLHSTNFSRSRSNIFGNITDILSNIYHVKIFSNTKHEQYRLDDQLKDHIKKEKSMLWSMFRQSFIQGSCVTIFTIFIIALLLYSLKQHKITVGDFAFAIIVSGTIIRNVYSISSDLVKLSQEYGCYVEALSAIYGISSSECYKNNQNIQLEHGQIEFKNVSFGYDKMHQIFKKQSLIIAPRQKVGIMGLSGSGKSSLANLIVKLYEPSTGFIKIDGYQLSELSLETLRSNITLIPQEPSLFNRTIFENICYGNPDASSDEVYAAAKKALCDEFIDLLPQKYESLVGEKGVKLSGGQKQRILIARAFLRNSKIIILDEPTSALDENTENKLQKNLSKLYQNKTALVISHRTSVLKNMDRIIVIDKGVIVQDVSSDELQDFHHSTPTLSPATAVTKTHSTSLAKTS